MAYKIKLFFLTILTITMLIFTACSKPSYYQSDLQIAYDNSDYKLLKRCLKYGISADIKIKENPSVETLSKIGEGNINYECSLMHSAVLNKDYKALQLFLKSGASQTIRDSYENTPFHLAIKLQDYKAYNLLKKNSDVIYSVDYLGNIPLLTAISVNDSKLYNSLLDNEDVLNKQNSAGESALMLAAKNRNRDLEKKLIKKGINVNLRDINGNSLLMRAVLDENIDEINFLLANSADVNITNKEKKNALDLAAEKGSKEISTILVNAEVDIDNANVDGKSALITAVQNDDTELVADLLAAGSNLNLQDNLGNTALIYAVKQENVIIVEKLLEKNANTNLINIDDKSALFYSLSALNFDISKRLIEKGADVDITDDNNELFVKKFMESNNSSFTKLLIDNNAIIDFYDALHRPPLLIAIQNINPDIVESLVLRKVDVCINNDEGKSVLFIALDNGDLRSVKALLNGGANPNVLYEDKPLIIKAINDKNFELLSILIDAKADVNISDENGNSLLLTAVINNENFVAQELIRGGADCHIQDETQSYLMDIALNLKNYQLCMAMFASPDNEEIKKLEGKRFLVEVVRLSDIESLRKLLAMNMDVNTKDSHDNVLLTTAINNKDIDIVKLLVSYGAQSNIINDQGKNSRDYLKGASFKIKYEVGKTIYHYTDSEIIFFIIIFISLVIAFIVFKLVERKKINEKWFYETSVREEKNKKIFKKKNSKEPEPRYIFRVVQLFEHISLLPVPEKENQVFNSLMVALLRILDPFVNTRGIYKDLFENQYEKQVKDKYSIDSFDLSKDSLKLKIKTLKKYKKHGVDLRLYILIYIYNLYKYFDFQMLPDEYKLLCFYLGYSSQKNKKYILKIMKRIEDSYKYIDLSVFNFDDNQSKYIYKKTFNIAVCATMSSGKSTFINALLGSDCLPARNEATTAIITSIYDLDGMHKTIGYATRSDIPSDISNNADLNKINEWNDSADCYNHVYLQGDFDSISCEDKICVINDTPGTNNSGDKSHHDITMDFLTSHKLNAIIFVVNSEHISTTDEKVLLSEIYKNKVSKDKTPIIFVLNKADCIDNEKEDIKTIIEKYKLYLNDIGFSNPKVFPVSSKAARLMKMASKDKYQNFSKMEQREFALCYSEFLEDYDFSFVREDFSDYTEQVSIGQKEYLMKDVLIALNRTGINAIEKEIESLF